LPILTMRVVVIAAIGSTSKAMMWIQCTYITAPRQIYKTEAQPLIGEGVIWPETVGLCAMPLRTRLSLP